IVLSQFDNDTITSFLNSSAAHKNVLKSLDSILMAYPIDGVNIDIEYTGELNQGLRDNFSLFLEQLHTHLQQRFPRLRLSVDVLASAATVPEIWDIERIQHAVDYIIIMAYDFHRRSSIMAGPVAPLFGGKRLWDSDVTQYLRDFLEKVPQHQIVL